MQQIDVQFLGLAFYECLHVTDVDTGQAALQQFIEGQATARILVASALIHGDDDFVDTGAITVLEQRAFANDFRAVLGHQIRPAAVEEPKQREGAPVCPAAHPARNGKRSTAGAHDQHARLHGFFADELPGYPAQHGNEDEGLDGGEQQNTAAHGERVQNVGKHRHGHGAQQEHGHSRAQHHAHVALANARFVDAHGNHGGNEDCTQREGRP